MTIMHTSTFGGFSRSCESALDVSDQRVAMSFPDTVGKSGLPWLKLSAIGVKLARTA